MSHLTKEQRYTIEVLLSRGESKACIAKTIGRSKSVVSRAIGRNRDKRSGQYRADLAQRKYEQHKECIPKRERLTASVQATVDRLLEEDYSPEQVVGHCRVEGVECVSHERIYQYVWADKKGG
ncbi:MAG: helix-turn-helix domain-containing protein, partial [Tenuifilaceae bacterium]|nr:helix-turn-helix domain-containing protein [Tenuifilaceae bacterium]